MIIKNTTETYSSVPKFFHWTIGLMIIIMLIVGFIMGDITDLTQRGQVYALHKATGTVLLVFIVLRLLVRLFNVNVLLPSEMPVWQKYAAHTNIYMLYLLMFVMPISGFLMTVLAGRNINIYGIFTISSFMQDKPLAKIFNYIHHYTAFALISCIILHILAALYHHFIRKDKILKRMLFGK